MMRLELNFHAFRRGQRFAADEELHALCALGGGGQRVGRVIRPQSD
jgi:hypothetical protein